MIIPKKKLFAGAVLIAAGLVFILLYDRHSQYLLSTKAYFTRGGPSSSSKPCSVSVVRNKDFNCSLLFEGDADEIKRDKSVDQKSKWPIPSDTNFYYEANNCAWIHNNIILKNPYYVSEEEKQFPLAFALNVYQSPYQIFRFLKVIYRPHNLYCLHYDKKSHKSFQEFMITISECLPNVIVPKNHADVVWAGHTIVDAQMNCLNDLYELRTKYPWKYVMTLCGKEVPLRTNREMVNTLRKLNGTSSVFVENNLKHEVKYWTTKYEISGRSLVETKQKLGPVPFNLKMAKSIAYYGLSIQFVDYLLHNEQAIKFKKFMDDTKMPDEHFVATLFNRTGIPGGRDERYVKLVPITSSYFWLFTTKEKERCTGWNVNSICVISNGDLHQLDYSYNPDKDHQTFFHNKFFIERDRVVMDCAEEELLRRNRQECLKDNELTTDSTSSSVTTS